MPAMELYTILFFVGFAHLKTPVFSLYDNIVFKNFCVSMARPQKKRAVTNIQVEYLVTKPDRKTFPFVTALKFSDNNFVIPYLS